MKRSIVTALLMLLALQGCGAKKIATNVMAEISTDGMAAIEGESDLIFAREAMPAIIKTLEVLSYGNRKNTRALALLSKAYGSYAFGFIEEEMLAAASTLERKEAAERAKVLYARGRDYGIDSLKSDSQMERAMTAPFPEFQRALSRLSKRHAEALFWTAFNWANWMNLSRDDPMAIVALPKVQAMIDRVIEIDPGFYFGSARAFRGVLASSRPAMLGGDLPLAKSEFDEAISLYPGYLMTKVLYAQYYARQANDAALFRQELAAVESSDAGALPEQALTNGLAKRRASLLLKMEKELF